MAICFALLLELARSKFISCACTARLGTEDLAPVLLSGDRHYDLAKDQLATIQKLCGSDCEYYENLAEALAQAHAL